MNAMAITTTSHWLQGSNLQQAPTKQAGKPPASKWVATTLTPETAPKDPSLGYVLVEKLIFHQVHKFQYRFGGEFNELVCEANLAFVNGHAEYISGISPTGNKISCSYATQIRRWVWYRLFDAMRNRVRRQNQIPIVPMIEDMDYEDMTPVFELTDWMEGLGPDAAYVADLALNPPPDIELIANSKGGQPRNIRSTIRVYLSDYLWEKERIDAAFDEVKAALRGEI